MKRTLPLLLILLCSATWAESGAYRVEIILLRNLAVTAEATEVETLLSFSAFPSLEEPALAVDQVLMTSDGPDPATIAEPADPQTETLQADAGESEEEEPRRFDLPDELRVILEKSRAVDDAWRRLRGSANYRPLLFAAWEQNRTDYYPPMRIHDQQVLETQLRPPTPVMVADLTAADPLAMYRSSFYQIDGSVQLRRSRFLHLHLDLEFREPPAVPTAPAPTGIPAAQDNGGYRVYTLQQNRQVRTGQMQYFDTPQYGALVLVTAIAPLAAPTE
jgi:hypothetical protein